MLILWKHYEGLWVFQQVTQVEREIIVNYLYLIPVGNLIQYSHTQQLIHILCYQIFIER